MQEETDMTEALSDLLYVTHIKTDQRKTLRVMILLPVRGAQHHNK